MANLKECKGCGIQKETTQFSKCKKEKDLLQRKCKDCNKKDNHKFRTEIDPTHHNIWQRTNNKRHKENMRRYRKADDTPKIYYIQNPAGETYIGATEMKLSVRKIEHKQHFKRASKGKRNRLPGLHDSMEKWGWDKHKFGTIIELEGFDRQALLMIEKSFINAVMITGKSLNSKG